MALIQARGVPTLALELNGQFEILHLGHDLGKPKLFKKTIEQQLTK